MGTRKKYSVVRIYSPFLHAPDDIVLGHKKYVMLQNLHSGNFELSRDK